MENEAKSPSVLVCAPVSEVVQRALGLKAIVPGPGHVKGNCGTCNGDIWIGPQQQKFKTANPTAPVLCFMCALKVATPEDSISHLGGTGSTYISE